MNLLNKIKTLMGNDDVETDASTAAVNHYTPETLDKPPYTFVEALHAARRGDLEKIQDYLNFNQHYALCQNWDDCTLLHEAARYAHPEVIAVLLAAGAQVNNRYQDQTTLHLAIAGPSQGNKKDSDERKRHQKTVQLLLSHHVDMNALNGSGEAALHLAARLGYSDLVAQLLKHGAAVDEPMALKNGQSGRTALLVAARYNKNPKTLQLLLEQGADPNLKDSEPGYAPLHYIAAYHANRLTEAQLVTLTQLLLHFKADVNAYSLAQQTPLHLAVHYQHIGIIKTLMAHGADIYAQNAQGLMAMGLAARQGDAPIVDYLLSQGCDLHKSKAIFHAAACPHSEAALKLLIEKGADVDQLDTRGYTPLFAAVAAHSLVNVKLLLESGADSRLQPKRGLSLSEHAFACWGEVANLSNEAVSKTKQRQAENARAIIELLGGFDSKQSKQYV